MADIQSNNDLVYDSYLEPEVEPLGQQLLATTAITSINGITGPTITFGGGASGFSYVPAGATITLVGPLTTKGDLYTRDSANGARLPIGTDGQVLTADSAQPTGNKWATPSVGTVTSFSATPTSIFDVANPTTTPALSLDNQNANIILAGPSTGAAATPSFRALVNADIPVPVTYTAPTLLNSWVNFGGGVADSGYLIQAGIVYLRGTVKDGTIGSTVFTLPSGYRPAASLVFAVSSGGLFGHITIDSSGNVTQSSGTNTSLNLDNIRFVAGQ